MKNKLTDFLIARYVGVLLLACAVDAENHVAILAIGLVEAESTDSWTWFCQAIKSWHPRLDQFTFISDRDKGLLGAVCSVFPGAPHRWCAVHLKRNIIDRFGHTVAKLFMKLVYAPTPGVWEEIYAQLTQVDPIAAAYLAPDGNIPPKAYSNAHFEGCTFGYVSSNIGMIVLFLKLMNLTNLILLHSGNSQCKNSEVSAIANRVPTSKNIPLSGEGV